MIHKKHTVKERLVIYKRLTEHFNGEDLFELYATLKKNGVVKSSADFQKYVVFTAINFIDSLIENPIKACSSF